MPLTASQMTSESLQNTESRSVGKTPILEILFRTLSYWVIATFRMSLYVENEATIDPVAVIRLVRQLLPGPGESMNTSHTSDYQSCASGEQTIEESQEHAGCLLWDLATLEEAALIMAVSISAQASIAMCSRCMSRTVHLS